MISEQWRKECAQKVGLRGEIDFHTAKVGMTLHIPCEAGDHVVDVKVRRGLPPEAVAKHMVQAGWTIGSRLKCPDCAKRPARKKKAEPAAVAWTQDKRKMVSEAFPVSASWASEDPSDNNGPCIITAPNRAAARFEKKLVRMFDKSIGKKSGIVVQQETIAPLYNMKDMPIMQNPKTQASSVIAVAHSQEETRRRLKRQVIEWLGEVYDEDKCCYKSGFSDASIAKETGLAMIASRLWEESCKE